MHDRGRCSRDDGGGEKVERTRRVVVVVVAVDSVLRYGIY